MIGLPLVVCDKSKKGVDEDEDEDDGEDKRDSDLRKTDRRLKRKLNLYLITYPHNQSQPMEAFNKPSVFYVFYLLSLIYWPCLRGL